MTSLILIQFQYLHFDLLLNYHHLSQIFFNSPKTWSLCTHTQWTAEGEQVQWVWTFSLLFYQLLLSTAIFAVLISLSRMFLFNNRTLQKILYELTYTIMEKCYGWASETYYSSITIVAKGPQNHLRLLYKY